jgi:hypothetical protein
METKYILLLIALVVICYLCYRNYSKDNFTQEQKNNAKIVFDALKKIKDANGKYPDFLKLTKGINVRNIDYIVYRKKMFSNELTLEDIMKNL